MTNNEQLIELARRLVACPRFRWLPGMVDAFDGAMVTSVADNGTISEVIYEGELMSARPASLWGDDDGDWYDSTDAAPDLRDPATRGCVLELVREAWSNPDICPLRIDDEWTVRSGFDGFDYGDGGQSEAAALVAALEAAPPR